MAPRNASIRLADGRSLALHAPGLKQMRRGDGTYSFYRVAGSRAVKLGYSPKTVALTQPDDQLEAEALAAPVATIPCRSPPGSTRRVHHAKSGSTGRSAL